MTSSGTSLVSADGALSSVRERAAERNIPLHALWEITQRCHQRCRHCYLAGGYEADELTTEEGKDLLRQMADLGTMFLILSGGEPLLRDDLFEIIDEARRLGFAWKLLTSGTLVGDEEAKALARRHPINVDVSLHGLEETHDALTRVPGSFRAALEAIDRMSGLGIRVVVKMVLTPRGLGDLAGLRRVLEGRCAAFRVAARMQPDLDGKPVAADLQMPDAMLAEYYRDVYHRREYGAVYGRHGRLEAEEPLCNAGRSALAVSPGGDVRACIALREVCGNVRHAALGAIWWSAAMEEARGLVAGERRECRECLVDEYCFYCPGLAETETGCALGVSPAACREARIRKELAGRDPRALGDTA